MMKQPFRFTFCLLICFSLPLTVTAQTANIPDPNLRAAIEAQLGKAPGDTITTNDIAILTSLDAKNTNINDLTGLEHAINLTTLDLEENAISDISSLAELTQLTYLYLSLNSISDISPVANLSSLEHLSLGNNNISDISPVAGLINLSWLNLMSNSISDISPLVANTGLGSGDIVNVTGNVLDSSSINAHIPALQSSGVEVQFDNTVDIPDPNLRTAIEAELGKAAGDTITTNDMAILTQLGVPDANISNLTGLEGATNLTWLNLNRVLC